MSDNELLARIVTIVRNADKAQTELEADETASGDEDDSSAVDIDYDAYQEIHKLLRESGELA